MIEILQSGTFKAWLSGLKDREARVRVQARIDRMGQGNSGDTKPVGQGVSEARIHYGPGYRLYFLRRGESLILLLAGGDKKSQHADIQRAQEIAAQWKGEQI